MNMNTWSIRDLATACQGRLKLGAMPPVGGELEPVGRIIADLNALRSGDVYWELGGRQRPFAEEAFARGALGIVVSGRHVEPWAGKFAIDVDCTRQALERAAHAARRDFCGQVIIVSGTPLQSETAQFLASVCGITPGLSPAAGVSDSQSSAMLHLLNTNSLDDAVVCEFPASSLAEILQQSTLCRPRFAVINSLAKSETAAESDDDDSTRWLESTLNQLPTNGCLILNGDDHELRRIANLASTCSQPGRILTVGRSPNCDLVASDVSWRNGQLSFVVEGEPIRVAVWGRHYLPAAMAAFAIGRMLGHRPRAIAEALGATVLRQETCSVTHTDGVDVVEDASSDDPNGLQHAWRLLRDMEVAGRRVLAFGDDGSKDLDFYQRLGISAVTVCSADVLLATGPRAHEVVTAARMAGMPATRALECHSDDELERMARVVINAGDVILVQGASRHAVRHVLQNLRRQEQSQAD